MKARTQMKIGEISSGVLHLCLLSFILYLFVYHQLPAPSTIISIASVSSCFAVISALYFLAIRRKNIKVAHAVFSLWWVLGLYLLIFAFIQMLVAGKLTQNFLMALIILLSLGLPLGLTTFLWWVGLRGLVRVVETESKASVEKAGSDSAVEGNR